MRSFSRLDSTADRHEANRLFRYDRRIAINATRATLSRWHDVLIVALALIVGLAILRSWFADRPWQSAAQICAGAALLLGAGTGRLIFKRLVFHAFDGPLAAEALNRAASRRYTLAWHATALLALAATTLIIRPSLVIATVPGYLFGSLIVGGMSKFSFSGSATRTIGLRRIIAAELQRPRFAIVCAIFLLLSLWLADRSAESAALVGLGGIEAAAFTLAMTKVDDGIVRFRTIAGHGLWRIVGSQGRSPLLFAGVAVPACLFSFEPVLAAIIAAICALGFVLMIMRIMAYRLYGKRTADLIVFIFVALLVFSALSVPVALPVLAIAILWQLQRRTARVTWLLP